MTALILAIDCGNSRLKWGLHGSAGWRAQGMHDYADLQGFAGQLRAQPRADRVVAVNVAGPLVGEAVAAAVAAPGIPQHWVKSQSAQYGVRNLYDHPEQLGADRWAALIGARALHDGACLVVCAGTATTVDILDAEGGFQGGLILPGVELMCRALAANTAQLPLADGKFAGKLPLFGGLDGARFRRQVSPGDTLELVVELGRMSARAGKGSGKALLNGVVACECELMFVLVDA